MGKLLREGPQDDFLLNGRCLIGRAPTCHLVIEDARVSAEHAVIAYRDGQWWVRDLSSTNGTFVDERSLEQEVNLVKGSTFALGHRQHRFTLVDESPPCAEVTDLETGEVRHISPAGGLFPEGADTNGAYLYQTEEGWMLETEGDAQILKEAHTCNLGSRSFLIRLPLGALAEVGETVAITEPHRPLSLRFRVSSDEEHVSVDVSYSGKEKKLGHRSYSYLLLTLARARCNEERAVASPGDAGWLHVRDLARGLRVTPEQLNLWVWRARRHIQELDESLSSMIVERRPHTGTLRLGTGHLTIEQV